MRLYGASCTLTAGRRAGTVGKDAHRRCLQARNTQPLSRSSACMRQVSQQKRQALHLLDGAPTKPSPRVPIQGHMGASRIFTHSLLSRSRSAGGAGDGEGEPGWLAWRAGVGRGEPPSCEPSRPLGNTASAEAAEHAGAARRVGRCGTRTGHKDRDLDAPAPGPHLDQQQHAGAAGVPHVNHPVQVRVLIETETWGSGQRLSSSRLRPRNSGHGGPAQQWQQQLVHSGSGSCAGGKDTTAAARLAGRAAAHVGEVRRLMVESELQDAQALRGTGQWRGQTDKSGVRSRAGFCRACSRRLAH